ncbi:MAG: hypothetical protein PVG66_03920 [Chromatiales bacterium]
MIEKQLMRQLHMGCGESLRTVLGKAPETGKNRVEAPPKAAAPATAGRQQLSEDKTG